MGGVWRYDRGAAGPPCKEYGRDKMGGFRPKLALFLGVSLSAELAGAPQLPKMVMTVLLFGMMFD